MQEVKTQPETKGKCCAKYGSHRAQRRGECGSSHKHDANVTASPLDILQQRFARGEIDAAEFEEKRRLITNA